MIKIFDIIRTAFNGGTTWDQAKAKVHKELGVSQAEIFSWKSHLIMEIDSAKNIVILQDETGKLIKIKSDRKTTQNLMKGIFQNKFLSKYGADFVNEIRSWHFSYSRTKSPEFVVDLRSGLKPEDQTTEKRKKMYHKRNVIVTDFFIKNLIEKTL